MVFLSLSEETVPDITLLSSLLVLCDSWPDFPPPSKDFLFAICLSDDSDLFTGIEHGVKRNTIVEL